MREHGELYFARQRDVSRRRPILRRSAALLFLGSVDEPALLPTRRSPFCTALHCVRECVPWVIFSDRACAVST